VQLVTTSLRVMSVIREVELHSYYAQLVTTSLRVMPVMGYVK